MSEIVTRGIRAAAKSEGDVELEEGLEEVVLTEPQPTPEPIKPPGVSDKEAYTPEEVEALIDQREAEILASERDLDIDGLLHTYARARDRALSDPSEADRQEGMSAGELALVDIPTTIKGVVPHHARSLGMTPDEFRERATKAGYTLDHYENVIGRHGYSIRDARRKTLAFMPKEERRRELRGQFVANIAEKGVPNPDPSSITAEQVLPTNREIVVSDTTAGVFGSGPGMFSEGDPLDEVSKEGSQGYKSALSLVSDLFDADKTLAKEVPIFGQREQGWYDYAVNRALSAASARPDLSGKELDDFKRKMMLRAVQEIALYKTVGLWTAPVFVPYEITDDGQVRIPRPDEMSLRDALKTNIEIVGMTEDKRTGQLRAVGRQVDGLQYMFDLADLGQSGLVGALERKDDEDFWDSVVRGVANRRNFVEYALESELAEESPWLAMGLGFIPAVLTPDLFAGFGLAKTVSKGVDYATFARKASKVAPDLKVVAEGRVELASLLREAVAAQKAGDTVSADSAFKKAAAVDRRVSDAEIKIKNEFEPTILRVDERDARVGERFGKIDPNIAAKQSSRLDRLLPGTELRDSFVSAHPSVRKAILSAKRGDRGLEAQVLRNQLYSGFSRGGRRGIIERLIEARRRVDSAEGWKVFAAQEARRLLNTSRVLEIEGLDGADLRRLDRILRDGGTIGEQSFAPLSELLQLNKTEFMSEFRDLLRKTVDVDVPEGSKIRGEVAKKFGLPLYQKLEARRKAWSQPETFKSARDAIDEALEAIAVNNEARAVAAAIEYKDIMTRIFKKGDDFTDTTRQTLKRAYEITELSERAIKFADQLTRHFDITPEFAQRVARVLDARAEAWAAKTGRAPHSWWDERVGGVQSVASDGSYLFKAPKSPRNRKIIQTNSQFERDRKPVRIAWVGYNSKGEHLFQFVDAESGRAIERSTPATADAPWGELPIDFSVPQGWDVVDGVRHPRGVFGMRRPEVPEAMSPEELESGLSGVLRASESHPRPPIESEKIAVQEGETYLVGDASDVVNWLIENTRSEINRTILERIKPDVLATIVIRNIDAGEVRDVGWVGVHRPASFSESGDDVVEILGRGFTYTGLTEETLIHELLHNATHERLSAAFEVWLKHAQDPTVALLPAQRRDVKLINSFLDVHDEAVPALEEAARIKGVSLPTYMSKRSVRRAPTDPEEQQLWASSQRRAISEMISYGFTNLQYQDILKSVRLEKESLWTQFTRKIAQLFGMSESDEFVDALSRVVGLTDELLNAGVSRVMPIGAAFEPQFMAVPRRDRLLGKRAAVKAPRAVARAWRRQEAASELGLYSKLEELVQEELPRSVAATDRVMTRKAQPAQPAGPVIDPKTGQPRVNRKTGEVIMRGARPAQEAKYKPGESVKVKVLRALGVTPNQRRWELREGGKVVGTAASREALYASASKRLSRAVEARLAKLNQELAELRLKLSEAESAKRDALEAPVSNWEELEQVVAEDPILRRIETVEGSIARHRRMQHPVNHRTMLSGNFSEVTRLPTLVDTGSLYTFTKGIKAEEFELSHLDEFLDDLVAQGRTKVTRDEILEHLRTGRTAVTELQLGRLQPGVVAALKVRDKAFSKLQNAVEEGRAGPSTSLEHNNPNWWHVFSQDPYLVEKQTVNWTSPPSITVPYSETLRSRARARFDMGLDTGRSGRTIHEAPTTTNWRDLVHFGFSLPGPRNPYGRWIRDRIVLPSGSYEVPLKQDFGRAYSEAQQAAKEFDDVLKRTAGFDDALREYEGESISAERYAEAIRFGYPRAEVAAAARLLSQRLETFRTLLEALGDDVVRGQSIPGVMQHQTGNLFEPRLHDWFQSKPQNLSLVTSDPIALKDLSFLREVNSDGSLPRVLAKRYRESWARLEGPRADGSFDDFPRWEDRYYAPVTSTTMPFGFLRYPTEADEDHIDKMAGLWRLVGWRSFPLEVDMAEHAAPHIASRFGRSPAARDAVLDDPVQGFAQRSTPESLQGARNFAKYFIGPVHEAYFPRTEAQKEALRKIGGLWRSLSPEERRRASSRHAVRQGVHGWEVEWDPKISAELRKLKFEAGILMRRPREYAISDEALVALGYNTGVRLDLSLENGAEGLEFIDRLRQLPEWVPWERAFFDAEKLGGSSPLTPRWSNWRLSGGENYSEFLVRLESPLDDSDVRIVASRLNSAAQFGQGLADLSPGDLAAWERLHKKYPPTWTVTDTKTKKVVKRLDSKEAAEAYALEQPRTVIKPAGVLPPGSSIEEASAQLNDWIDRLSDSQFRRGDGSHWDQDNVLVHMRTTDRSGFMPIDRWWSGLSDSQLAGELSRRYPSQWARYISDRGGDSRDAALSMREQLFIDAETVQEARDLMIRFGARLSREHAASLTPKVVSDYLEDNPLELLDAGLIGRKKVLFVEEIQSDWHQAGRAQGYSIAENRELKKKTQAQLEAVRKEIMKFDAEQLALDLERETAGAQPGLSAWLEPGEPLRRARQKLESLQDQLRRLSRGPVPEAPFKSTDSWLPLALKRLFKVAAEGDYDGIAFTRPELASGYVQMPKKAAEKYYGQIVPSVAAKYAGAPHSATYVVQEGDDLFGIVRQWYGWEDTQQIKHILEANRKKLGSDRVDDLLLELDATGVREMWSPELTPGTKLTLPGAYAQKIDLPEAGVGAQTAGGAAIPVDSRVGGKVPYVELTPEIRATVMEPQPQFMATPGALPPATGQRALTEFLDDGRAVIQVFEEASDKGSDASVIIRQVGQILRRDLDASDLDALTDWLQSLPGRRFRGIKAGANRFEGLSDELIDEAEATFGRAFENYVRFGAAPSKALGEAFEKIKQPLVRIYPAVRELYSLPEATQSRLDELLTTEMIPSKARLPTAIEYIKRNLMGDGPQREVAVFDTIAEEARRLGISTKSGDDLLEEFEASGNRLIRLDSPMTSQLFGGQPVQVLDADQLMRLQEKLSQEVIAVAGAQTPKAPLDTLTQSIEESSTTEALRQLTHGSSWRHVFGRAAVTIMFGGDAYADLRAFPPVMRMNIMAAVRPIQEAIGAAVRLGLEGDVSQLGKFLGGESLSFREGRPVLSSGRNYFGDTQTLVRRLYDGLKPEEQVFVHRIADMVNEVKTSSPRVEWSTLIKRAGDEGDELVDFMSQMFHDKRKSEYLNAMFRAAGLSGGDKNPWTTAQLFEMLTYYAGITVRPEALRPEKVLSSRFSGLTALEQATAFMREVQVNYKPAQALHMGVVVAGHGAAGLSRDVLVGLGVVLDAETAEGLRRWLSGMSVRGDDTVTADKYHKFIETTSRLGVDIRPQEDFLLTEGYYIPKAVRERIDSALARANIAPKKEGAGIIASADDELQGLVRGFYTYQKTRMTRGAFMIRQRYFLMNTIDHFTQLALTVGFGPALVSTTRLIAQNALVLPGIARSIYVAQRTPGVNIAGPQAVETWRKALQRGGDKAAQFVGNLMGLSKYRIDVNAVMDGTSEPILIGKKLYSPRDIRRIATEEGIFASFDTRALERNIKAERVATFEELNRIGGKNKKQILADVADDLLKLTSDTAEAWSERERLGAMITLMEMGYDPRTAARITIDALYDYAGSMSKGDRFWLLNMVLPFWAFQKNANRQIFDAMFSPWGAYRMGVIRRTQEYGADIVSYLAYDSIVDPYGVDVESLPPEVAEQYWAFRKTIEWGFDSFDTLTVDQREMLEAEFGPLELLDPATKEFLENGYGGPEKVPLGVRRAMSMVFRDKNVIVQDGKVYELSAILRTVKRQAPLGVAPYVVPRPDKSGLAGWQRSQPMIAVPERMTEDIRTWWSTASQVNPDFPTMMMLIPDSTINAGMRHLTYTLAAFILMPTSLLSDLPSDVTRKVPINTILKEVFPYERAPLAAPIFAELGVDSTDARKLRLDPEFAEKVLSTTDSMKTVMGAMPVHPEIIKILGNLITVPIEAIPAAYDPYRAQMYRQEGYSEEEIERLSKVLPERYYLPPGAWSLAVENTPFLGEMNKFLFDLEARPMERLGSRSKIVYLARNVLGVQTAEARPSRIAAWEDTTRETQTPTPPR